MSTVRIAQMRKFDVANGTGIRSTLFVSGCHHDCKGCFNKEYQNFKYGEEWTPEVEEKFLSYVADENVTGVSFLGGEPFHPVNAGHLARLAFKIKEHYPNKPIWVWTGYTYEEILEDGQKSDRMSILLNFIDVLVDGKFMEEQKDLTLKFRGSSNQRLIDVQKTLEQDEVVLYDL